MVYLKTQGCDLRKYFSPRRSKFFPLRVAPIFKTILERLFDSSFIGVVKNVIGSDYATANEKYVFEISFTALDKRGFQESVFLTSP